MKQAILEFGNGVKIYADRREGAIVDRLKALGADVIEQDLQVDFILSSRVGAERKTARDFAASIIDRRLFRQAQFLSENFERTIFVVEGDLESVDIAIRKEAMHGAMVALAIDFGVQFFLARDSDESAKILYTIAKREQLQKKRIAATLPKRRALTTKYQQLRVLEAFPGIGPKSAHALLKKFKSLKKIFNADVSELADAIGRARAEGLAKIVVARCDEQEL